MSPMRNREFWPPTAARCSSGRPVECWPSRTLIIFAACRRCRGGAHRAGSFRAGIFQASELAAAGDEDWSGTHGGNFLRSLDDGQHWQQESKVDAQDQLAAECLYRKSSLGPACGAPMTKATTRPREPRHEHQPTHECHEQRRPTACSRQLLSCAATDDANSVMRKPAPGPAAGTHRARDGVGQRAPTWTQSTRCRAQARALAG